MAAGNWDPTQNINWANRRVEWPQGPLDPNEVVTARWLEAWVVQGSTGTSQRAARSTHFAPDRWYADEDSWKNGSFQGGLAVGIALLAYIDGNAETYDWWLDAIDRY